MPVELIASHPKALGMNGAAFGHLMRLTFHFWLTDCRPLPVVDNQLYVLARAFPATWKANRVEIKEVLQDVIPELHEARLTWQRKHDLLSDLRSRGHSARRLRKLEKSIDSQPSIASVYEPKIAERNRSPAPILPTEASIKSGFVEKPRR